MLKNRLCFDFAQLARWANQKQNHKRAYQNIIPQEKVVLALIHSVLKYLLLQINNFPMTEGLVSRQIIFLG